MVTLRGIAVFLLLSVLMVCMTGCVIEGKTHSSDVNTNSNVYKLSPRATVIYAGKYLPEDITVSVPAFEKSGALTKAVFVLQNLTDGNIVLEYRVEWKKESGFPMRITDAWDIVHIAPASIATLASVGDDAEAYSVIIKIRYPENN
ncbi:DUF1425 domain-containing protein [Desulfovibrio gilichinskyi]|nr:DUF1425 domain-containing protein [Desulfovibrio gilichinskyi]